jgi:hypothetical protein
MARKRKTAGAASPGNGAGRALARQLSRLEKRLARLEKEEARRSRQLDGVRAAQAETRAQIAELEAVAPGAAGQAKVAVPGPGPAAGADAPHAYCMREKRKVPIAGAEIVVLGNGRRAYAGTCADCGARVIAIVGSATAG